MSVKASTTVSISPSLTSTRSCSSVSIPRRRPRARGSIQPRLNKGTLSLKEWIQVSLDLAGLPRDPAQGAFQADREFRFRRIVSVVRSLHPYIVPKRFDRIKFGAVLRQGTEVEAVAVTG